VSQWRAVADEKVPVHIDVIICYKNPSTFAKDGNCITLARSWKKDGLNYVCWPRNTLIPHSWITFWMPFELPPQPEVT